MELKITNGYKNPNSQQSHDLNMNKCVITNYDPFNKETYQEGDLMLDTFNTTSPIKVANEPQTVDSKTAKFNSTKYELLKFIAGLDGDTNDLTRKDIRLAERYFNNENEKKYEQTRSELKNLGITNITYSRWTGVSEIAINRGSHEEYLRIDFKTFWEWIGVTKNSSNFDKKELQQSQPSNDIVTENPIKTEIQKPELAFYDEAINKIISDMNEKQIVKITKDQLIIKIKEIAKNVPCTESLVIFMMSSESFIRSAQLVGSTNKAKITVGFGHTQKAIHNYNFKEGFEISNEKAFEWLEQDIKDVIELLKHKYLPDINWEEVPQSVQDAIVDLLFNAGESKIKEKNIQAILKEASESGSYAHAAVKVSRFNSNIPDVKANLMRRCCYRFLLAIEDLPKDQKIDAMKAFDSYYKETLKIQNSSDKAMLEGDWIEAQKALGLYEEEDNVEIYRVQQGDNLWNIAGKNPKTVEEIKKLNNLKDNNIYVGQRLKLPKSTPNNELV